MSWKRIDKETIEATLDGVTYQIKVVGENASAKPTRWGLYQKRWSGSTFVEVLTKPSRNFPKGHLLTFEKQSLAKRYVLMKYGTLAKHPQLDTSPRMPIVPAAAPTKEYGMQPGKRYTVFSIRTTKNKETLWIRAGHAYVNPDDSMTITLDVLPLNGELHVRETGEKADAAGGSAPRQS